MVQQLFGYDAYTAGLIMSPAGIAVMLCMPISGFLLGKQFDARYLIFFGVLCVAAGSYWAGLLNLEVSPWVLPSRSRPIGGDGIHFCADQYGGLHLFAASKAQRDRPVQHDANEGASLGVALVSIVLAHAASSTKAGLSIR